MSGTPHYQYCFSQITEWLVLIGEVGHELGYTEWTTQEYEGTKVYIFDGQEEYEIINHISKSGLLKKLDKGFITLCREALAFKYGLGFRLKK